MMMVALLLRPSPSLASRCHPFDEAQRRAHETVRPRARTTPPSAPPPQQQHERAWRGGVLLYEDN